MEGDIRLLIVSPEGTLTDVRASSVTLPGVVSPFQVLKNHAPLITSLESGSISWTTADGRKESLAIRSGFVKILDNQVFVCAEP